MERALHAPIPYSAWTAIQTPGQLVSAGPREVDMSSLQIQLEVRAVGSGGSTPSQKWFAVRCGGGPVHPVRMRWEDGWRGDVEHLANGRESTAVVKRLGKRLMRLVASTGWPKEAVRIREAKQQGDKVLLSLVSDSPEILSLPWEALPVGDGGVPLGQLLDEPIAYSLPGAGVRPRKLTDHPDGGRLLLVACGGGLGRQAALRGTVAGVSARPSQELLSSPGLSGLADALQAGARRGRPVSMLHLVSRVEGRDGRILVRMGGDGQAGEWVDAEALASALSRSADTLRAVVLTLTGEPSCRPLAAAEALHRAGIEAVIVPRVPLSSEAVLPFVARLHDALVGRAMSFQRALRHAVARLHSDGLVSDAASLQLFRVPGAAGSVRPFVFAPYQGLAPYGPGDAARFFGRATETRRLVDLLTALTTQGRPRFVVVAGAPNSGRTSLVEAGLFASMREREPLLRLHRIDPRVAPLAQLDEALGNPRSDGTPSLVVVDPLDPLLKAPETAGTARHLVNRLWRLAASGTSRVSVVIVVAVDHLAACGRIIVDDMGASLENLAYDERHRLFVTEPGPRGIREIIDRPAFMLDLQVDPAFADQVMRAAAQRPGSLREVSLALDMGWRARRNGVVGSGVVEAGGFEPGPSNTPLDLLADLFGVLARRLSAALPDDAHRKLGVDLLRALTDTQTGGPVPLALESARPSGSEARARFDRVLSDLRAAAVVDQRRADGSSWVLLRVPELAEHWPGYAQPEQPVAPVAPPPRPAARPARSRGLAWVAALLLFSAAGAGLFGWWGQQSHQRHQARDRFEEAQRVSHDPTTAAVLLRQIPSMLRPDGWASAANLALQSPQAARVLRFEGGNVQQLAFSPDSSHILIRVDGSLRLMRPQSTDAPRSLRPPAGDGGFVAARFSPSGANVVTVTRSGRVLSWPVDGGPSTDIAPAVGGDAGVVAAFSPKGTHVVRAWGEQVQVHAIDGSDVQTARLPGFRTGAEDAPCCAVVSGDGERWAIGTEGGRILLYKAGRRSPTTLRLQGLRRFHLNRGGTHLLALGDGTLRIIDLVRGTGSTRTPASVRVDAAVFSPDGRHIAVDYLERESGVHKVRSVAVSSRRSQRESPELDGRATALAAGEGGNLLLRATDGTVAEIDVETGIPTTEYRGHRGPVREVRQSPDGMWLATSGVDGSVRLWRRQAESPALVAHPPRALMGADPLVFAPGGEVVGGVSVTGRFVAARLEAAAEPTDLGDAPGPMQLLRVSAAGDRIVAVDAEESLHVRSARDDDSWSRSLPGAVLSVSPQLDTLLVRDGARGVASLALDRPDARPEPLPVPSASVTRAAYTTDGRWLALGYEDGKVHLLDTATGDERGVVQTDAGRVTALCVSVDGQRAAIGSSTGALRLWRPQSGAETPLVTDGPVPRSCTFAEDDGTLVVQTGTEAEVWTLAGPSPRRLMVAPTRRPAGGATAWIDTQEDALVTLDAQGRANSWLLDPEELHARLWKSTPTCELGGEEPVDLKRWCACEACFGRTPDACAEQADDPLTADLDRVVSWCPMAPDEHG